MSSEAKKNKARNSYIYNGGLKSKKKGIKRIDYYTASDRQKIKKEAREEKRGKEQMMSIIDKMGIFCTILFAYLFGVYAGGKTMCEYKPIDMTACYNAGYESGYKKGKEDRQQGKWIEHEWAEEVEGLLISNYECSECHSWIRSESNYCPNCGAKMRGVDDE